MTLPVSPNSISMDQIRTEIGSSGTIDLQAASLLFPGWSSPYGMDELRGQTYGPYPGIDRFWFSSHNVQATDYLNSEFNIEYSTFEISPGWPYDIFFRVDSDIPAQRVTRFLLYDSTLRDDTRFLNYSFDINLPGLDTADGWDIDIRIEWEIHSPVIIPGQDPGDYTYRSLVAPTTT